MSRNGAKLKLPLRILVALAFAGSLSVPADAMTFRRAAAEGGRVLILAEGPIVRGDTDRFQTFLDGLPSGSRPYAVSVDSGGGNVGEAVALAQAIITRNLAVAVLNSHECASACFLLFAAAPTRIAGRRALIAVHRASNRGRETVGSLFATAVVAILIKTLNVPSPIIQKLVTTPSNDLSFLSVSDLRDMGATIMDDDLSRELLSATEGPSRSKDQTPRPGTTRPTR